MYETHYLSGNGLVPYTPSTSRLAKSRCNRPSLCGLAWWRFDRLHVGQQGLAYEKYWLSWLILRPWLKH